MAAVARPTLVQYATHTISPVYAFINEYLLPDADKAVSEFSVQFGDIDRYRLIAPIGTGKYSVVFLGRYDQGFCAIKVLKDISFAKIQRELFILNRLASIPHVVHVIDVNVDTLTQMTSIVTNYVPAANPRTLYQRLTPQDIAYYIYCLLFTLDQCHARGVMHRDIKPGNVCIDHANHQLCVIDWGLSDLYYPRTQYSVRVSTLRYKAPELLLSYRFYDYGIDVWGAGCILAEMLFDVGFIKGGTPEEVIGSIAHLWGRETIYKYCERYGIELPESFVDPVGEAENGRWDTLVGLMRPSVRDRDAIDLVKRLLTVDHGERITARDALRHSFFARNLR
jgi:casein kinase II subunit alpha